MKHLMPWGLWPTFNIKRIEIIAAGLQKFGSAEMEYYQSRIPITIFEEPKIITRIQKEEANHVIIKMNDRKVVQLSECPFNSLRADFYDENLPEGLLGDMEETLTQVKLYTGNKIEERKLWYKMIILMLPILYVIIAVSNIIHLIQAHSIDEMYFSYHLYTTPGYSLHIQTIILCLFIAWILYKFSYKPYFP